MSWNILVFEEQYQKLWGQQKIGGNYDIKIIRISQIFFSEILTFCSWKVFFRQSFLYFSISLITEKSQTCPKLLFTHFDSLNQWSNETKTLLSFSHAKWYPSFASLHISCVTSCKSELNVRWTFISQIFLWQSQHNCHINPTRCTDSSNR